MSDENPEFVIKSPGDAAAVLPYLYDVYPAESIALVGLAEPRGAVLGRVALPLPADDFAWQRAAQRAVHALMSEHSERGETVSAVLVYLLKEPSGTSTGWDVTQRLMPLARALRYQAQAHGLKVVELLSVSNGRWWSYLCCGPDGFGPEGTPVPDSAIAAAARTGCAPAADPAEIAAALRTVTGSAAAAMRTALDEAVRGAIDHHGVSLLRHRLGSDAERAYRAAAMEVLTAGMDCFRKGATTLDPETTAAVLLALQDRTVRDQGMRWTTPEDLPHARRLWQYLVTQCAPPYGIYACPALTLLGIAAWAADDTATARFALRRALDEDPQYRLAELMHEVINQEFNGPKWVRRLRASLDDPPC